jgi:radical SAM protein with 4Fe4S-binding SPASM domain
VRTALTDLGFQGMTVTEVKGYRDRPLSQIVSGEMRRFWSLNKDGVATCRDCEYRYFCPDCRPWASGHSGDLRGKSPVCTYNPYTGEWGKAEEALNIDGNS